VLEVMRYYPKYRNVAARYAAKTLEKSDYSQFKAFSTDLYNFVYFIVGDDAALKKLSNPKAAKMMRDKTTLPVLSFNRYLRAASNNTAPANVSQFLMQMERSLRIGNANYSAVRRNISNFSRLSSAERKATVTKLLYSVRAKLRSSDIIDDFSQLVADRDLEVTRVKDTEPQISTPDITTGASELALYRLLVGTDNVMRTKRFLDLARAGNGIPPQFTQGYMPIIEMVDDIVKSGPMYVQLLKQIHKRAKNTPK